LEIDLLTIILSQYLEREKSLSSNKQTQRKYNPPIIQKKKNEISTSFQKISFEKFWGFAAITTP